MGISFWTSWLTPSSTGKGEWRKSIPALLMVGLPNTLILAVTSGILGLPARHGPGHREPVPDSAGAMTVDDLHRYLPRPAGDSDHPDHRPGLPRSPDYRPTPFRSASWRCADRCRVYRRDLPIRHPERGKGPARRDADARSHLRRYAAGGDPAGHPPGAPRAGEPVHLPGEGSSLVFFLGLAACERELFRIGAAASHTGNLSPLVAGRPLLPDPDRPADPLCELLRQAAATGAQPNGGPDGRQRPRQTGVAQDDRKHPHPASMCPAWT